MKPKYSLMPTGKAVGLVCALPAIFFLIVSHPLDSASKSQEPKLKLPQYEAGVTLKLVQVYVTGKDRKPVTDLTAADFVITDNGQNMPVEHFEKHLLGKEEDAPPAPLPAPQMNRKFFLFFDFAFIDARGILKAKEAALHFINTEVQPKDAIGLISYSAARSLTVHEYLTPDHEKVRQVIEGFGLRQVTGRAENLAQFVYSAELEDVPAEPGVERPLEQDFFDKLARLQLGQRIDEGRRQSYVDQARQFILTLNFLAKSLRYIPGYKNIVFFSGGIARNLIYGKKGVASVGEWQNVEELAQEMSAYDEAQADSGLRNNFTAALKEFKASNCPVYAVDVSRTLGEVDLQNPEGLSPAARELAGGDSLRQFAGDTGGKYFSNTMNTRDVMADIQTITSAYYVLGYTVNEKWDGKFHKIKVKVNRKGCNVFAQGGYFSPRPFRDYSSFEKLLHVIDLALSETPQLQVPAEVAVAAIPVLVKGWSQVAALARIPKPTMSDILGKKVEAFLLIFDKNGNLATIKRFQPVIPEAEKDIYYPVIVFTAKPGQYTCRMILRNMETGRAARGTASLSFPDSSGVPLWLDPPLLLLPDTGAAELAASAEASLSGLFAYDAASYVPIIGTVPAGTGRLLAALRCTSGGMKTEFDITAALVETESQSRMEIPISVLSQIQDGPTRLYFLELSWGNPKPGSYTLYLVAKDREGAASAFTTANFDIRQP
jgi:VWFA-related protein